MGTAETAYVGVPWLADHFGVSPDTVRQRLLHVRQSPADPIPFGKLPAIRVGDQYRVHRSVLETFEVEAAKPDGALADPAVASASRTRHRKLQRRQVPDHLGDL